MRNALALLFLAGLTACGPTDYTSFCEHASAAICQTTFRCWVDDARAQWGNITNCTEEMKRVSSCEASRSRTCQFDPVASSRCLDDLDNLPCDGAFELPASCALECKEP